MKHCTDNPLLAQPLPLSLNSAECLLECMSFLCYSPSIFHLNSDPVDVRCEAKIKILCIIVCVRQASIETALGITMPEHTDLLLKQNNRINRKADPSQLLKVSYPISNLFVCLYFRLDLVNG